MSPVEMQESKIRTSRKEWACYECGCTIDKGSEYMDIKFLHEEEWRNINICMECLKVCNYVEMKFDDVIVEYGKLSEYVSRINLKDIAENDDLFLFKVRSMNSRFNSSNYGYDNSGNLVARRLYGSMVEELVKLVSIREGLA